MVRLNGAPVDGVKSGTYLTLDREWKRGDEVEIVLDFSLRAWPGEKQLAGRASLYRGPILLAYDPRFDALNPDELPVLEQNFDLRIPARSLRQIDPLQRMAVIAVSRAFNDAGIDTDALDRERVGVMSGCASGQEVARMLAYRMNYAQINAPFPENRYGRELIAALRDAYPPVTEDTGPGMLNNVIAGRVAHYFDFRGISCNVDYDEASSMAALALAKTYLSVHGGMVVVVGSNDLFDMNLLKFSPGRVDVYLVSTLSFARQHRLPVISVLREVTFSD
jgi:hypothetical protein